MPDMFRDLPDDLDELANDLQLLACLFAQARGRRPLRAIREDLCHLIQRTTASLSARDRLLRETT